MAKLTVRELRQYQQTRLQYKSFHPGDVVVCDETPLGQSRPNPGEIFVVVQTDLTNLPKTDGCPTAAAEIGDILVLSQSGNGGKLLDLDHSGFFSLATQEKIDAWEKSNA